LELKKRLVLETDRLDTQYAPQIRDPDFLYQAIRMPLEKMVDEIRISLQFYASQMYASVEGIYMAGGGALLRGLDRYIGSELALPVQKIDPFIDVHIDPNLFEEEKIRALGPVFASAVGLARAAAGFGGNRIPNELDVVKEEERNQQKQGIIVRLSSLSSLLLVLLAALFFSFRTNQIETQKIVVDKRLGSLQYRLSFIKNLEKQTGQMSAKFRELMTEKGEQPQWSLIFHILSKNMPAQAWLTSLDIQPGQQMDRIDDASPEKSSWHLTLKGRAYSGQAIRVLYNTLQKEKAFYPVNLNSIVLDEENKKRQQLLFEITCGIQPNFVQLAEGE
jgi:Tfp pilus assembly protein PilN